MSESLTERYDERIAGILSCYDRLVITGTLPVVCYAAGMTGYLNAKDRGRDAHYWAPPAQNRTCGFPAYGSHLGCLTAKRTLGHGWRVRGLGSQSSASLAT